MGTQASGTELAVAQFAASLAAANELANRARLFADYVRDLMNAIAVVIYVADTPAEKLLLKAISGEARATVKRLPIDEGLPGLAASTCEAQLVTVPRLARESYAHLDVRRTVLAHLAVPLIHNDVVIGILEVLAADAGDVMRGLPGANYAAQIAAPALAAAAAYESERNSNLEAVSRLAQLYELEKSFHSTLEMPELMPIVAAKARQVLSCEAVNLWMVTPDETILLAAQDGSDPTQPLGSVSRAGESIAATVADSGEPVLLNSTNDSQLAHRNQEVQRVHSVLAAPIVSEGSLVGVLEAVNKDGGFDDHDAFALSNVCETAAGAMQNASRLQAERKAEILELLVAVSGQITSTLNLENILQTVVNDSQALIAFDRAAIALEQRGRINVRAVSGMKQILAGDAEIERLREMMEWASLGTEEVHVTQTVGEIDDPRPETRALFASYFEHTGMRAFYARPLRDDQSTLGVLVFESRDASFLTPAHLEIIKVLAGQVTVALRNAQLYKEVPFIGVLEPLLERRRKFRQMDAPRRRRVMIAAAAGVALLLVPVPMRVSGTAVAAPARSAQIQAPFDGVVRSVFVREGDSVQPGTVLAQLEDWEQQAAVANADAKLRAAVANRNRALAANDGTEAGIQQSEAAFWENELRRTREWLDRTRMRTPIAGIVATPRVEHAIGRRLEAGETFAELVDSSEAVLDVALSEDDITLVRSGQSAAVKLDAFPARTFRGRVNIVAPRSERHNGENTFFARVAVPNDGGLVRSGMQGQSKVSTGWRPLGVVLFRDPALWLWQTLWSWLGW